MGRCVLLRIEHNLGKGLCFILMLCLVSVTIPIKVTHADTAPFFIGGVNIKPYQENSIELSKENLVITFNKGNNPVNTAVDVDAQFTFVNTGDKVSLKVGFPFSLATKPGFDTTISLESLKVKVKINGKEITPSFVASGEGSEYAPLIYFNMTFDKHETKNVEVSYESMAAGGYFLYVLNTGSYWKGPIGTLDMTFKFPYEPASPNVLSITPGGYKVDGNEVVYHLTNYEPLQNIEVEFLPYYMYEKVNPFRLKAEATSNAKDWFDYAMALFPENPLASFDDFVNWYSTSAFMDYVNNVLNKAISLQDKNSGEYITLKEIYDAHYRSPGSFVEGLDAILKLDSNYINLPPDSMTTMQENVSSIKSTTEGKVLGYFLEYVVVTDLKQNRPYQALADFNQLLTIAGKYFDKEAYTTVSPVVNIAMAYAMGKGIAKYVSPAFTECFVPSVMVQDNTVVIHFDVPYDMGLGLTDFSGDDVQSNQKDYQIKGSLEKTPPYGYNLTLSFRKNLTPTEFSGVKNALIQKQREAFGIPDDSHTVNLLYPYFSDILNNLTMNGGKLSAIKSSISLTPTMEIGLANLMREINQIVTSEQQFKGTIFDEAFGKNMLTYLYTNKSYFDNVPKNSAITFNLQEKQSTEPKTPESTLVVVMAAVVAALLIAIALLMARKDKSEYTNQ